jgi:hypothetical protein
VTTPQEFVERLDAVAERLERLAARPPGAGLTEPDQPSGEQWEWGQVWAHLAEFPGYWLDQIDRVFALPDTEPVPFGRTRADPHRIEAIERDRWVPPEELMAMVRPQLARLRTATLGFTADQWSAPRFAHPTLGDIDLSRVMQDFLVGHLEAHADQLDSLTRGARGEE